MKRFLLLVIIIGGCWLTSQAQVSRAWVRLSSGAPSSCPSRTVTIDTATGNVYTLRAGTGCVLSGTVSSAAISSIQSGTYVSCADAGASDAYACNLSPAITAYTTRMTVVFSANTSNTGAASLNLNSLGAKTIKKVAGGVTTDLADNDIRTGQVVVLSYDGTNFQMQSTLGNAAGSGISGLTTGQHVVAASSTTIATDGIKRYVAILTQTGTDAPVATVLENSLGGTLVWTRSAAGVYNGTLAGVFLAGKSGGIASGTSGFVASPFALLRFSDNVMQLTNATEGDENTVTVSIWVAP